MRGGGGSPWVWGGAPSVWAAVSLASSRHGPNTGSGHSSQISYMEAATDYIVKAICAVKRSRRIKAIDARRDLQDAYMADMRRKMRKTVWQNAACTAFYRKNMTGEVTSLSPEPVTRFILSRKWFRMSDYHPMS